MKIRKATVKDIPAMIDLAYKLFITFEKLDKVDILDRKYWKSKKQCDDFKKLLRKKNNLFLVVESDSKVVGYIGSAIIKNYDIFKIKKKGLINTLYVLPKYRGKGIAKKLVNETLKWFRSKGINHFTLGTHALHKKAILFWRHIGFTDYNLRLKK